MQRFENLDDEDMSMSSQNSSMFSGLKTRSQLRHNLPAPAGRTSRRSQRSHRSNRSGVRSQRFPPDSAATDHYAVPNWSSSRSRQDDAAGDVSFVPPCAHMWSRVVAPVRAYHACVRTYVRTCVRACTLGIVIILKSSIHRSVDGAGASGVGKRFHRGCLAPAPVAGTWWWRRRRGKQRSPYGVCALPIYRQH